MTTAFLLIALTALLLDAMIGDPDCLWRRWPHPVTWIGKIISAMDRTFNRETWTSRVRRASGIVCTLALVTGSVGIGVLLQLALIQSPIGMIILALIASTLLAQRSLHQHVERVRLAFSTGGLSAARQQVAMIVGRDPDQLDEAGVCRAAIESCAENFSDGIVAPAFWLAVCGLPGLIAYKAINTADLMIGHRTPRHQDFGWAAARLDDLLNLVPARLSGVLIAIAAPINRGGSSICSLRVMWRDARKHRSPNAGWPESAMAGALGIALSGPRRYGSHVAHEPYLNDAARHAATPADIGQALSIFVTACTLQVGCYALALAVL